MPVSFPDTLYIGTAVSQIEENQFWLEHALYSEKLELIAAKAKVLLVYYGFKKTKRLSLDSALMKKLETHRLSV